MVKNPKVFKKATDKKNGSWGGEKETRVSFIALLAEQPSGQACLAGIESSPQNYKTEFPYKKGITMSYLFSPEFPVTQRDYSLLPDIDSMTPDELTRSIELMLAYNRAGAPLGDDIYIKVNEKTSEVFIVDKSFNVAILLNNKIQVLPGNRDVSIDEKSFWISKWEMTNV